MTSGFALAGPMVAMTFVLIIVVDALLARVGHMGSYLSFMPASHSGNSEPVTYVQTPAAAGRVEAALAGASSVALDCEAAGFHRYSDRLCLVQLSTPDETFVLDPLAVDPVPCLKPFLEDRGRRVVMHGGAYDLRLLARDLGIMVASPADTQIAASLLGETAVGLQALLERHLGVRVSKKFQRADWAKRPLTREMIDYAAGDTRHLHRLIAALEGELRRKGRLGWAEEEYRRLAESAADARDDEPAPDPVTRFKLARRMDDRSVTALREVIAWRDGIARAWDRAPFRVVGDAALAAVVTERPASIGALAAVKGFPARLAHTKGRSLLDVLGRVDRLPESRLSPYPPYTGGGRRPTPEEEAAFERLKGARNRAAGRLGLERGRMMANHVLRSVAAAWPGGRDELADVPEVRRWQVETVGDELLAALKRGSGRSR